MMLVRTCLSLIFFTLVLESKAFSICLFGSHLIQTARMSDLNFSEKICYRELQKLEPQVAEDFITATESKSLTEAFLRTDEGEFCAHKLKSKSTNLSYDLFIWSAGENIVGSFLKNDPEKNIVARISDGAVTDCSENFLTYEKLPFYYTN